MSRFIKVYAKVNLFLRVLDRRSDGYHNILSLMAHINLADLLKLEYAEVSNDPGQLSVEIVNAGGSFKNILENLDTRDNLVVKAVEKAAKVAGFGGKYCFHLEKNIPAGAGLGGGSADAAGALQLVAPFFKLSKDELLAVAAETGADVPFHLHHGFALCEGIGEIIEELDNRLNCSVLICNDDIHVDTARAYRLLNRKADDTLEPEERKQIVEDLHNSVKTGDVKALQHMAINDFESVVFKEYRDIAFIKERVIDSGADYAMMTGSGSTVIGLFLDRKAALAAAEKLKDSVKHVFLTDFA